MARTNTTFSGNPAARPQGIQGRGKYGYDIHVPALPGCHSQGETKREALENIKDAILTYLGMEKEVLKGAEVREVEVALT